MGEPTTGAGPPAAASRGRGTGGRAGRGGGRARGRSGDQGRGQENGRNQNDDAINDNIQGNVRNVIENNDCMGCTYKEFLACNPKEYDGKGGAVVYTRWIEKMEYICTLGREVAIGMSWDNFKIRGLVATTKPSTIQKAVRIVGTLTDEALRNGSIKKNLEKRGNGGEPSKDRN
ncbi:hypothetical protein Tco_1266724, partial [Tanacetum coccineum]